MTHSILLIEGYDNMENDFSPCFNTKLNADGILLLTIQEMIYNHFRDREFKSDNLELNINYHDFSVGLKKIYLTLMEEFQLNIQEEDSSQVIYFEKIYKGYLKVLELIKRNLYLYLESEDIYKINNLKFIKNENYLFFNEIQEFSKEDILKL